MKSFTVSSNDADQRLDSFLKKLLENAPLSLIFKLLRKNGVKVDKKRRPQDYRLIQWEIVEIYLKDEEFDAFTRKENTPKKTQSSTNLDIVYEDADLLVINKEAGISVHPWDHKSDSASLIELVQDYLGEKYNSLTFRPSLVHRIDRETSGAILIAKNKKSLDSLLKQLQNGEIEKIYEAVVLGFPNPKTWTIRKKLLRIEGAKSENKVQINEKEWLPAVTHYEAIEPLQDGKYSLIQCRIETGRTHQIRVHLASIWNPILGDKTYGDKGENSYAKRILWVDRQLLHAKKLVFIQPSTHKKVIVIAPYKSDMNKLIKAV